MLGKTEIGRTPLCFSAHLSNDWIIYVWTEPGYGVSEQTRSLKQRPRGRVFTPSIFPWNPAPLRVLPYLLVISFHDLVCISSMVFVSILWATFILVTLLLSGSLISPEMTNASTRSTFSWCPSYCRRCRIDAFFGFFGYTSPITLESIAGARSP